MTQEDFLYDDWQENHASLTKSSYGLATYLNAYQQGEITFFELAEKLDQYQDIPAQFYEVLFNFLNLFCLILTDTLFILQKFLLRQGLINDSMIWIDAVIQMGSLINEAKC